MNRDASAASITITPAPESGRYNVEVQARVTSQHAVSVSPLYLRELQIDEFPAEAVLREAFTFLLERESNSSILTRFDLREIEHYFPEFRREIDPRLRRAKPQA